MSFVHRIDDKASINVEYQSDTSIEMHWIQNSFLNHERIMDCKNNPGVNISTKFRSKRGCMNFAILRYFTSNSPLKQFKNSHSTFWHKNTEKCYILHGL